MSEDTSSSLRLQSYEKSRAKQKKNNSFFCRDGVTSRLQGAKLRKKGVKSNGFWKINAIQHKIKAKRVRTRKNNFGLEAKCRVLAKELDYTPSMEPVCGIGNRKLYGLLPYQEKRLLFFLIYVHELSYPRLFLLYLRTERLMLGKNN